MKKIFSIFGLLILISLLTGALTAAAPLPTVNITLISGLPSVMKVGDTATVVVQVTSDQEFLYAAMLPNFHFPGRGLMAVNMGGDRVLRNTAATLEITFVAKNPTAGLPDEGVCPGGGGQAAVNVAVGARFAGGYLVAQRFPQDGFICVTVEP